MDFCDLQAALLVRRNQKKARDFYAADEIWNKASMRPECRYGIDLTRDGYDLDPRKNLSKKELKEAEE